MRKDVTMPVCMALLFKEMLEALLYKTELEGEEIKRTPREMSFTLRYKLTLNKTLLDSVLETFKEEKTKLVVNYGEADGDTIAIRKECEEGFKEAIDSLLASEVTIMAEKIKPEEFDSMGAENYIMFSEEAFKAFYCYMVEDEAYIKALQTKVSLNPKPVEIVENTVSENVPVEPSSTKKAARKKTSTKETEKPTKDTSKKASKTTRSTKKNN